MGSGGQTSGLRRAMRLTAFCVFGLAFFALLLPALAVSTPMGQRFVAGWIEQPLLARLQQSVPAPLTLTIGDVETRVRPSYLEVTANDVQLDGEARLLSISTMDVRIRYMDVLRQNLVPRRITIDRLEADIAALGVAQSADISPAGQSALDASVGSEISDVESTQDGVQSARLNAVLNALGGFDELAAQLTQGSLWAALQSITVETIELTALANSALPILRDPDVFTLSIQRESPVELVARLSSVGRDDPLRLVMRHAESGAPEGPAMLAQVAGSSVLDGQAFSHFLIYGLRVRDLTSGLSGPGPIAFDSELAAELLVTRASGDNAVGDIDQVAVLLESGSGYLVASEHSVTILEALSVPLLYTRQSGHFALVSGAIEFQETGGRFSGRVAPHTQDGRSGIGIVLRSPRYRVARAASLALERTIQRGTTDITLRAFMPDGADELDISLLQLTMGDATVGLAGTVEFAADGPVVSLAGQSTPMDVDQLGALWPMPLSPKARDWFLNTISEGRLSEGMFTFAGRLSDIVMENGRAFLPDDMMRLDIPYENLVMRTIGDLPPVFGLDGALQITGRTVRMAGSGGVGRLPSGENIQVANAEFFIPDHALENPDAQLDLTLSGPASGFLRMAVMDPILLDPSDVPFDPQAISGQAQMTTTINAVLADQIDRDGVRTVMQAQVSDFSSSQPLDGRTLADGQFDLLANADGFTVDGQANVDGVRTQIAFSDADGSGLQVSMRLDAAGRERIGLDFGDYLTGTIGVDVGPPNARGESQMQIDLRDAALSIPELGWTKPPGAPAQASFAILDQDGEIAINQLSIAANGLAIRGSLRMANNELRTAQFDSIAVDGVGRFALALTRNAQGSSARISGDRFVLRPELLRGDREAAGAIAVELALDQLVTEEGASLSNVRLSYAQTGERITDFDLRAAHSDGTDLVGSLSPQGNNNLIISSGNAGTFLRFLGLYDRAQGGQATLVLDPQSVGGRVAGQLLLRDFEIVGEPAMERIFTSGSNSARSSGDIVLPGTFETAERIEIEVTNILFDRTPERLIIHDAEGWGPSLGGNLEGVIDYEAARVSINGTYVPFFSINNIFSRIPLIGQALGGRDTEGLLGITFQLVGSVESPQLQVNPISLLAPGVFRNIFEYQQGG